MNFLWYLQIFLNCSLVFPIQSHQPPTFPQVYSKEDPHYSEDPTYPTVLEITEKDGQFYYEYYFISPGNSAGIGIAVTYTKWGRWKGLLELNTENGYVTCYNGDTKESGIFQTFVYDVMSDRFVETSNDPYRESFEKNDEYEYEL